MVFATYHFFVLVYIILVGVNNVNGAAYYGKLIQSGWGTDATQSLAGDIYAVDKDTFQVIGFNFDATGAANDAFFLLGTSDGIANGQVDDNANIIPNPLGQMMPLVSYNDKNVMLELPAGKQLSDYKYIAVGSRTKTIYGIAVIVPDFVAPVAQRIGEFSRLAHGVRSGQVTILNDRMIQIAAFTYDGQGPDAFFYVGVTDKVDVQSSPYGKIPDELGVTSRKALQYSSRTIVLLLPATISARDLKWLSMFCINYAHDFGHVVFPANLNIPPYTETVIDRSGLNCEPMSEKLQVSWIIDEDGFVAIEMAGDIDRDKDYMAFGLSGSDSGFSMIGADVVVADWKESREPRAIDYHITAFSQCAPNGGACPDTSLSNNGSDDVLDVSGQITNGIVQVKYKRALITTENGKNDKEYKNGTEQHIVWAIGPLNTNDETAKHYIGDRSSESMTIDFGRTPTDNCPSFKPPQEVVRPNFKAHHLYGTKGTAFTMDIGQAASEQGYLAITGLPSWGIAWYVNGILIPELHLQRGVSYTFRVGGGTDPTQGSKYHPLYFTDDIEGGYEQAQKGRIFQGMENGELTNTSVGGYCEWKLKTSAIDALQNGKVHECFEEFKEDLYLDCDDGQGYTDFIFIPDASTPNLIYYQCYTHKSLGWKLHVYDTLPTERVVIDGCQSSGPSTAVFTLPLLLSLLIVSITYYAC